MLPNFFEVQGKSRASVIVGSKWLPDSNVSYPPVRRRLSRAFNWLTRFLFQLPVSDCQLGFKLYRSEAIQATVRSLLVKRFAFDLEVLATLRLEGIRAAEAPVVLRFSRPDGGRLGLRTMLTIARESAGIWYRLYISNYYRRRIPSSEQEVVAAIGPSAVSAL